jgi:hypothetical protein
LGIVGVLVPMAQCIDWLKSGTWTSVTVADAFDLFGLPLPNPSGGKLIGLQKIIDGLMPPLLDTHVSAFLLIVAWLLVSAAEKETKAEAFRQRKAQNSISEGVKDDLDVDKDDL